MSIDHCSNYSNFHHQIERLIPAAETGIVQISHVDEMYEHDKDPDRWRLFRGAVANYAIYKQDFLLPLIFSNNPLPESSIGVVTSGNKPTDPNKNDLDHDVLLMSMMTVAEIWHSKAQKIGSFVLIPGRVASFTNVDLMAGYGGYKPWFVEENKNPQDCFPVPIKGHHRTLTGGAPLLDEAGKPIEMPDLGPWHHEAPGIAERLTQINISNRVA